MMSRALLFYLHFTNIFLHVVKGDVLSFNLTPGSKPLKGSTVVLVCRFRQYVESVVIYKVDKEQEENTDNPFLVCSGGNCFPVRNGYTFKRNDTFIEVTIQSLQRVKDQKWWRCITNTDGLIKQFYLTVITEPTGVSLMSNSPCDLAYASCSVTCLTDSCTFPTPKMKWFYTLDNVGTVNEINQIGSFETIVISEDNACGDQEKTFRNSITIPKYTTFLGNQAKTIRVQCKISVEQNFSSELSSSIQFAVVVQQVTIYPDHVSYISLVENRPETVYCITSGSRPNATVIWYKYQMQNKVSLATSNSSIYMMNDNLLLTNSSLRIRAQRKDLGWNLTCRATNGFESSVTATPKRLEVSYSAKIIEFKAILAGIVDSKENISISEGSSFIVLCEVDSNPHGTIEIWHKHRNVETIHGYSNLTYELTNATCMDTGQFICKAWNQVESLDEQRIQLYVKCSPRAVEETTPLVIARPGLPAVFSLRVIAYPPPNEYRWLRNVTGIWEEMPLSDNFYFKTTDLQYNLSIFNVTSKDYGEYRLQITNGVGDGFSFVFALQDRGKPDSPYDAVVIGTSATSAIIEWTPGYNGEFQQTFHIQYRMTSEKDWRTLTVNDPNDGKRLSHTIEGLQPSSDYVVIVYASNTEGNSTVSKTILFTTTGEVSCASSVAVVAGIMGAIIFLLVVALVIVLMMWRKPNCIELKDAIVSESRYEIPSRPNQSSEEREYASINPANSVYENS